VSQYTSSEMIDANGREFGIDIIKSKHLEGLWIYYCFPYYVPRRKSHPPYPGFDPLKSWLNLNFPGATYQVTTFSEGVDPVDALCKELATLTTADEAEVSANPWATLVIAFTDREEAMLFRLVCS